MPAPLQEIKSVPSRPEKDFFISMLTRDIDLQDAVLDLLDNCVDGAIRVRNASLAAKDSFQGYWAHITFDESKFVIEDNCGGISWEIAKDYAFCLGKREGLPPTKAGMIGVVGIGMKRAIFKMGRESAVHSNHKDDAFLVTIPPSWFAEPEWKDFEADREKPTTKAYGTIIEVTALTEDTKKDFSEGSSFSANFPAIVAEAYSILIEKGFEVKINKQKISPRPVKLYFEDAEKPKLKGELIRPYIFRYKKDKLEVFVAVGYRAPLRTREEQDDEAQSTFAAREAGWTIICNNRVVLSNDRTVKTGWGYGGVPNFHNQFSCIAGVVEFRAPNMGDLPVTTTKRGIDAGKDIYTLVRDRMQEGLKHFTKNTNRWKGSESELKERFKRMPMLDLMELEDVAESIHLNVVKGEGVQKQFAPTLPEKKAVVTSRRISFVRKISEIEKVSRYIFNDLRDPNQVGETCFERILEQSRK